MKENIADFLGRHLKGSFLIITLLIIGIGFGISFAVDDVKIEGEDVGMALASAGRSIISVVTVLFTASILMCSLGELSKCKERNEYGMPVPKEPLLAFDPGNMPYEMPARTFAGKLTRGISMPISIMMRFMGYSSRGNPNVSIFYRKSNSIISIYTSNVFITSWTWMRETLYNIIVFLNKIYPIEEKWKQWKAKRNGQENDKISIKDTFLDSLRGGLLIWFSGQAIFIISLIAAISGYIGMLMGSVDGPVKLIPGLNIGLLLCFGFIGFFVSIVQFFHNIYLFLYTSFKKNGLSKTDIFYFLCDKYFITILLSLWIPTIGKWLISENGDFTIMFLDIGITYIILSVGFYILKKIIGKN